MSKIKEFYRKILSEQTRTKINKFRAKIRTVFQSLPGINYLLSSERKINIIRKKCISYLTKYGDEEQKTIIEYLKNNKYFIFPYSWVSKYDRNNIEVFREDGFPYVIRNDKKIFGKKTMTDEQWKLAYQAILEEQDLKSPHRYLFYSRLPIKDSVFADIGTAEGFLALDVIDLVKKIYLFECESEWVEALKMTFKPYMDKVEIVNKYVSDIDSEKTVTLDTFFKDKQIDYIKADIEGFEEKMLQGANEVFNNKIKQCLLCCYHRNSSEAYFKQYLAQHGFEKIEVNEGYMIWVYAEDVTGVPLTPPYVRRGVLYAEKK